VTPWIYLGSVVLIVIAATAAAIINARTLRRDVNRTFDEFRARLENDANRVVDRLFSSRPPDVGDPDRVRSDGSPSQ
jgi:hypothetical protein